MNNLVQITNILQQKFDLVRPYMSDQAARFIQKNLDEMKEYAVQDEKHDKLAAHRWTVRAIKVYEKLSYWLLWAANKGEISFNEVCFTFLQAPK